MKYDTEHPVVIYADFEPILVQIEDIKGEKSTAYTDESKKKKIKLYIFVQLR
jgi:hypothetical protein